ncbi:ABC transporter permease subunit [Nocardioides sp. GCM10027113]|uniref:ABC transporter permease subunit n=1 Tax=unclassified Nocardioides TaxID=2615069 RepID=UPI00360FD2F0
MTPFSLMVARRLPRPRRPGRATPAVLLVLLVTGTGLGAVVATSVGLMPLFGQPTPGVAGYVDASADLLPAVRETLLIATASTVLAAAVGLVVGTALLAEGRGSTVVRAAAVSVVAVPHLVGAAAVGQWLSGAGLGSRLLSVEGDAWPRLVAGPLPVATVLEFAWKESAFVALVVAAALSRSQRERTETASVLGAGPWQRWSRVYLPSAAVPAAAASLIVFVYTVGSYEVAWLLGRAYPEPLPVMAYRLFGSTDLEARPAAAAAATVAAGIAVLAAGLALLLAHRARHRGGLDVDAAVPGAVP